VLCGKAYCDDKKFPCPVKDLLSFDDSAIVNIPKPESWMPIVISYCRNMFLKQNFLDTEKEYQRLLRLQFWHSRYSRSPRFRAFLLENLPLFSGPYWNNCFSSPVTDFLSSFLPYFWANFIYCKHKTNWISTTIRYRTDDSSIHVIKHASNQQYCQLLHRNTTSPLY